jgi:hypothetical protein
MDDAKTRTPLGPELPQQLGPDSYQEARLHIARLEVERLRRERLRLADTERRAKIPLGASCSPDAIRRAIDSGHSRSPEIKRPDKQEAEPGVVVMRGRRSTDLRAEF